MLDFAYFTPIVHVEQKNKLARLLGKKQSTLTFLECLVKMLEYREVAPQRTLTQCLIFR